MNAVSPKVEATHADRPTSHTESPFRFIPGRPDRMEWQQEMLDPPLAIGAKPNKRLVRMTQEVCTSPYGNQIGAKIKELNDLYFQVCGRVDGLLASVDSLTTENVMLVNQIKSWEKRYEELQLRAEGGKKKRAEA